MRLAAATALWCALALPCFADGLTGGSGSKEINTWAGVPLGPATNLGVSPGDVKVPTVNDFILNALDPGPHTPTDSSPTTPSNKPPGAATLAPGQVTCATTATLVAAARPGVAGTGRISVTITNTTTTSVYIGNSDVTDTTGDLLAGVVGAVMTLDFTGAVYCIVTSGTAKVTFRETY